MPKCVIDGREAEFKPGENLIEVAKRVGVDIPLFCYHPGLSVVAQCRMCAVEVEKMPKLQTACSTAAAEGMVVHTQSARAKQNQKSVMEFLLINHPLDCPICDKSGECDLQDNSYAHGEANSRYTEERRTYLDLDMGPVIKKNMNRCIHCTRCIRFGTEVAGMHEMVALQRGNNTVITTVDGKPLETDYAGNYADICPTGSLTLKDFRFRKRVWYLHKAKSVCEGCSRGCNIELHQENEVVHRTLPRANPEVNKHWICDEGRFLFNYVNDAKRVTEPMELSRGKLDQADWADALETVRAGMTKAKKPYILVGTDLTQEEAKLLLEVVPHYMGDAKLAHFGTPDVVKGSDDEDEDKILRRTSKTANLHGIEKLGIKAHASLPAGTDAVLVVRGGRAVLPKLPSTGSSKVFGLGVFTKDHTEFFDAILPGLTWAEKEGTFVNFEGREQRIQRSIKPVGRSKSLSEVFMMWANSKGSAGGAA